MKTLLFAVLALSLSTLSVTMATAPAIAVPGAIADGLAGTAH